MSVYVNQRSCSVPASRRITCESRPAILWSQLIIGFRFEADVIPVSADPKMYPVSSLARSPYDNDLGLAPESHLLPDREGLRGAIFVKERPAQHGHRSHEQPKPNDK